MQLHQSLIAFNWNLLFSMITVVVLFLILKHFFFEKVHNFMKERENEVSDSLNAAEVKNKLADEKLEMYDRKLERANVDSMVVLEDAKKKAEKQRQKLIAETHEEIAAMREKANKEIKFEREQAYADMKNQVATLAVMAAEQIMEKSVEVDGQTEIIDNIIEKAGKSEWQN